MNTDFIDPNALIQLLVDQRQEALALLSQVQQQNQVLVRVADHQRTLLVQQQLLIDQLRTALQACQVGQQQAFNLVHNN